MRYFALLFFILTTQQYAVAASSVTISSISGASASSVPTSGTGEAVMYGAIAGDDDCPDATSTTFCNSCLDEELSCSKKRIHNDKVVTITFKYTGDTAGEVAVGYDNGTSIVELTPGTDYNRSATSVGKNESASITIDWLELCSILSDVDPTKDCVSLDDPDAAGLGSIEGVDFELLIAVGDIDTEANRATVNVDVIEFDADSTPHLFGPDSVDPDVGLAVINARAGDEKVYIEPTSLIGECPGPNNIKKFRVFYSDIDFDNAGYDAANYKDLSTDSDCNPSGEWVVDGLENNVLYYFRVASVDVAGNVGFLTDVDSGAGDDLFTEQPSCDPGGAFDDLACTFTATPGNILGLLPEDLNCFIATAAYGSPFHPMVKILRQFRDQVLKPTALGRSFIKKYYAVGPKAAHWVADKPVVRSLVRIGLLPFTAAAWFTLYYGPWGLALFVMVSIYGLLILSQRMRRKEMLVRKNEAPRKTGNSDHE